ncbi:MAG: DUF1206 domain-containing protein [Cyanophyceae cyanobacterium]
MQKWLKRAIAHPWIQAFILIGYAAKGSVYLLIGILAVRAALIPAEEAAGTYLTLTTLARQPLGQLFLGLLAVALLGYVLRRLIQVAIDPGSHSLSLKRVGKRIGYAMSATSYAGVSLTAANLAQGQGQNDDIIEDLANQLFELPFGEWLVFLGGLAVIAVGLGYLYGAWTGSYVSEFQSSDIHHRLERWATRIGKVGVAARGIAFVLIGTFTVQAAFYASSEAAGGMQHAFQTLEEQTFGSLWLGLVGTGFMAYGLYMFIAARYRRYAVR